MKPRKLRSPMKAIHEALSSIRLAVGNPICVQPTKTESFRDLLASFNSIYYTPAVSSSSVSSDAGAAREMSTLCYHLQHYFPAADVSPRGGEAEEEEAVSDLSAATASGSTCSSCLSASFSSATAGCDNVDAGELPTAGAINSTRFFFSPCTSKFIAAGDSVDRSQEPEGAAQAACSVFDDLSPEGSSSSSSSSDTLEEETHDPLATAEAARPALCRHSIPMALASRDPYGDFRSSMDEMVTAHGLRDWPGLQELLHCYLRLNDRKTHKFIVLAFADLLMRLAAEGKFIVLPSSDDLPHANIKPQLLRKRSFLSG